MALFIAPRSTPRGPRSGKLNIKVARSIPSAANSDGTGSSNGRESATIGAAWTPLLRRLFSRSARATGDGRGVLGGAAGAALGAAVGLLLPSGAAGGVGTRLGSRGRL